MHSADLALYEAYISDLKIIVEVRILTFGCCTAIVRIHSYNKASAVHCQFSLLWVTSVAHAKRQPLSLLQVYNASITGKQL